MSLTGKIAVVSGSTSGIGLGIAKCLAREKCNLMLHGSRPVESVKGDIDQLIKEYGVKVAYCQSDLSKPEGAEKLINEAMAAYNTIDILINNAGIQHVSPVDEFPIEKWNEVIAINLTSCFLTTRLVIPIMKKNKDKWGRIINISSVHGIVASANKAAYVSAKHGLNGLTKVTGIELSKDTNITCNAVCPGYVLTPLVQKQIDAYLAGKNVSTQEAITAFIAEKQPRKQFTTSEQVGDMVVFLCSESASNITGSEQVMDGGWISH